MGVGIVSFPHAKKNRRIYPKTRTEFATAKLQDCIMTRIVSHCKEIKNVQHNIFKSIIEQYQCSYEL